MTINLKDYVMRVSDREPFEITLERVSDGEKIVLKADVLCMIHRETEKRNAINDVMLYADNVEHENGTTSDEIRENAIDIADEYIEKMSEMVDNEWLSVLDNVVNKFF